MKLWGYQTKVQTAQEFEAELTALLDMAKHLPAMQRHQILTGAITPIEGELLAIHGGMWEAFHGASYRNRHPNANKDG